MSKKEERFSVHDQPHSIVMHGKHLRRVDMRTDEEKRIGDLHDAVFREARERAAQKAKAEKDKKQ